MPNSSGTSATQTFLKNLSDNIGVYLDCDGSMFAIEDIAYALKNNYGYSYAQIQNYNSEIACSYLVAGRPFIMSGDAGGGYSFVWVCDGIDLLYDYYCVNTIGTQYIFDKVLKRKFLHFNWGTDDDSVGYYEEGFSNYSPIRGSNYGYNGNLVTILVKP